MKMYSHNVLLSSIYFDNLHLGWSGRDTSGQAREGNIALSPEYFLGNFFVYCIDLNLYFEIILDLQKNFKDSTENYCVLFI